MLKAEVYHGCLQVHYNNYNSCKYDACNIILIDVEFNQGNAIYCTHC